MQLADKLESLPSHASRLYGRLHAARKVGARLLRIGGIFHRRPVSSDPQANEWTETLVQVIADLDLLNHNTEQDFLRIGGKLTEFIDAVNLISSSLAAVANEEQGLRASQALTHTLDRSLQMKERHACSDSVLAGMRQEVDRLKESLSGFHGTVSTFHTLGVLTRIETARLGSAGADFGSLAEDVKSLAGNVQARVESALEIADSLVSPMECAMKKIAILEEGQASDLPSIIAGVSASLASFREMQATAHDASVRLASRYEMISVAFRKLIVSVQFHDITRQQVEHVIEVLRHLCSESDDGDVSRGPQRIGAVLSLQSLQLADAGEKFAASVASVEQSLTDITKHVLEMADESRTLSGLTTDEKSSFFLQMEQGCSAILANLGHSADTEAATQATGGGIAAAIGRMRGPIEDIQEFEIQMHRIALNASICAAHIGASGDALGVLAGSMQQRAVETRQRAESIAETLDSMGEAANRSCGPLGTAPDSGTGNGDGCMQEMRAAVAELHSSSEHGFAQIAQIIARGTSLGEELSTTRASFRVGGLFAEAVRRARGRMGEVGEAHKSDSSGDGVQDLELGLRDLAKTYTMQAQRDVHESLTMGAGANSPLEVPVEQTPLPPAVADELGDNVEFF